MDNTRSSVFTPHGIFGSKCESITKSHYYEKLATTKSGNLVTDLKLAKHKLLRTLANS